MIEYVPDFREIVLTTLRNRSGKWGRRVLDVDVMNAAATEIAIQVEREFPPDAPAEEILDMLVLAIEDIEANPEDRPGI